MILQPCGSGIEMRWADLSTSKVHVQEVDLADDFRCCIQPPVGFFSG